MFKRGKNAYVLFLKDNAKLFVHTDDIFDWVQSNLNTTSIQRLIYKAPRNNPITQTISWEIAIVWLLLNNRITLTIKACEMFPARPTQALWKEWKNISKDNLHKALLFSNLLTLGKSFKIISKKRSTMELRNILKP